MGGSLNKDETACTNNENFQESNSSSSGMHVHEASSARALIDKLKVALGNSGEEISLSAQRLFEIGKHHLSSKSQDISHNEGFSSLFQAIHKSDIPEKSSDTTDKSCSTNQNSESETTCDDQSDTSISNNEGHFASMQKTVAVAAQTFSQWKATHDLTNLSYLCFSSPKTIYLQPLDSFPAFVDDFTIEIHGMTLGLFDLLQGFMQIFFSGMEVLALPPISIEGVGWKVRSRLHDTTNQKQYCVNDIFPYLKTIKPPSGLAMVGITWTDLYPEGYNFVMGEASFAHNSAVISFGRFDVKHFDAHTHQDVTKIDGKILWKLLRTFSHEMCHLFGLSHCVFYHCAMNESSSIPEAISQPLFLCPVCLRKLQQACGFDVFQRYQLLLKFLKSIEKDFSDCTEIRNSVSWLENCVQFLISTEHR